MKSCVRNSRQFILLALVMGAGLMAGSHRRNSPLARKCRRPFRGKRILQTRLRLPFHRIRAINPVRSIA